MPSKQSKPVSEKPAPAKKQAQAKAPVRARKTSALSAPPTTDPTLPDPSLPLANIKEETFVQAYLANGLNATQAYKVINPRAKDTTARTEGARCLAKPSVLARVQHLSALRVKKFEVDGEEILRHANAIATADARHLTEFIYFNCRYCHGKDNRRQRTLAEFEGDKRKHEETERRREASYVMAGKDFEARDFDEEGGHGYNEWAPPVEKCPNCFGHGVGRTVIKDTRHLPPEAVMLFSGVKEGKDGIEVKTHDKIRALDMMHKHKGLYEADNAQQAAATSPEALARMADAMATGRAAQLKKLEDRREGGFSGD